MPAAARSGRLALLTASLLAAWLAVPANHPALVAQQGTTFRTSTQYVAVDVVVTGEHDAPVTDLRKEDFEITENGRPQKSHRPVLAANDQLAELRD